MPQNTDLVTDLPADFEVFGQAVATSMADLLGGTSGQILAKNSNTDMDFVWIANDQGDITGVTAGTGISGGGTSGAVTITNSMATEITAKADLIVGTGNAAFDNLPVGANGTVLTADSTVSPTGLKWATPSSGGLTYAAWTPTTTGITAGNGTTVARYAQSGKFVTGSFLFTLGSTSSITGAVSFTLPVTAKSTNVLIGTVSFLDAGVGYIVGQPLQSSTTACYLEVLGTNTTYGSFVDITSTVPITWVSTDHLSCNFSYEAA
jgi:hypothetical protein